MGIIKNVMYLEASINYTIFHFTDGNLEIYSYTLKHFAKLFSTENNFLRIYRSFFVNKAHVVAYNREQVVLFSGKTLPIAKRRFYTTA